MLDKHQKHISHVCDGLFVGSVFATKPGVIKDLNIKTVISLGATPAIHKPGIEYHFEDIDDNTQSAHKLLYNVIPKYLPIIREKTNNYINVLVHCSAGKSRSVSIVLAYLIKYKSMTYSEAIDHVTQLRPSIYPNYGFREVLKEFAQKVQKSKAMNTKRKEN